MGRTGSLLTVVAADIVRDEAIAGGWVLIEDERGECTVENDDDDVALADLFVDACAAAVPDRADA